MNKEKFSCVTEITAATAAARSLQSNRAKWKCKKQNNML